MQQKQHIASHEAKRGAASQERRQASTHGSEGRTVSTSMSFGTGRENITTIRVPKPLRDKVKSVAADKGTTLERLVVCVFEEYLERNKGAAA